MANTFHAQVSNYVTQYKERLEAVVYTSVEDLAEAATLPTAQGGNMRVDTGFLRSSMVASLGGMPPINPNARPVEGQTYGFTVGAVAATIAGANLGQPIWLGFTASYAGIRESKDGFVRLAAQRWQAIVDANVAKLPI